MEYLLYKRIIITAAYLKSVMNTEVDGASRQEKDSSKWKMNLQIFQCLCKILGTLEVDLFASRLSNQIIIYTAWRPDPLSQGTDAMQQQWCQKFMYAFSPFFLITRVLHKVMFDQTENMILITPIWHTQAWYATQFLLMLIAKPILPSKQKNITA